ncbi:hypothetical protein FF80_00204 [Devosia sp. LC5]|nr:hypothetical protein FF80_00204 [Devosia sp. LC5]
MVKASGAVNVGKWEWLHSLLERGKFAGADCLASAIPDVHKCLSRVLRFALYALLPD